VEREEALELLKRYLRSDRMVKHCIAVGAVMEALARRLGEDEELWSLIGLLHDVDYEVVNRDPSRHGLKAMEILRGYLPEEAIEAIAAHNEHNGYKPTRRGAERIAHALRAADHVAGLIVATALVMPNRKLAEVKPRSLRRKFKQKDFARRVDRNRIRECERLGVPREEFRQIALRAMQEVAGDLGL